MHTGSIHSTFPNVRLKILSFEFGQKNKQTLFRLRSTCTYFPGHVSSQLLLLHSALKLFKCP